MFYRRQQTGPQAKAQNSGTDDMSTTAATVNLMTDQPTSTAGATDEPLIAESDDRYDLIGLDVINRATGEVESFIPFSRDEVDFVGMVEHREKGYDGTDWYTRRVWRTYIRPTSLASTIERMLDA